MTASHKSLNITADAAITLEVNISTSRPSLPIKSIGWVAITSTYGGCFPASFTETQPDRLVMSDNHSQPANHDPAGIQTSRQSRHDGQRTLGKVKSETGYAPASAKATAGILGAHVPVTLQADISGLAQVYGQIGCRKSSEQIT